MNILVVTSLLMLFSSTNLVSAASFQGDPYSDDGCDESRGCFDCRTSLDSCEIDVAWEPNPNDNVVKFTLWGRKVLDNAHISVGITSSSSMFDADVYSCVSDDTGMVMSRSWNPSSGRTTSQRDLKGVFDQTVTEVDGEIRCQFTRNMSLNDGDAEFFNISGDASYFLILSAGAASGGNGLGHNGGSNRGLSGAVVLSQTFTDHAVTTPSGTPEGDPYSDEGCGTERGCYVCPGTPPGSCGVNVAYEPDMEAGVVKFTLWGTMGGNEAHVSMGITRTQDMYDADVYSCITNITTHRLVRSWNPSSPARTTEPRNLTGVRDVEVSVMDGEIRCQFTRYMSLDNNDPEFFNISGDSMYYIIVSRGSSLNAEGLVAGHDERGVSEELVLSMSAGNMVTAQFGMWTFILSLIVALRVY